MECKYCHKDIKVLLNAEMQCFPCYNAQKMAKPERHNHRITPPKA